MATSTPIEPCPPPTELQKKISELDQQSKQQVLTDAKLQLADLNKINDEVQSTEKKYKEEYEKLKVSIAQISNTRDMWETQIAKVLSSEATKAIDGIVKCVDAQIAYLEDKWEKTKGNIPDLQSKHNEAQAELANKELPYKQLKDYKANEKDLNGLMNQSAKELGDQELSKAYFLVVKEIKAIAGEPPPPGAFNAKLETVALSYFGAVDKARKAKTALDQATADLQKTKKDYEDAKGKRREDILKKIVDAKAELLAKATSSSTATGGAQPGTVWEQPQSPSKANT
jgi:hypothetical protein